MIFISFVFLLSANSYLSAYKMLNTIVEGGLKWYWTTAKKIFNLHFFTLINFICREQKSRRNKVLESI